MFLLSVFFILFLLILSSIALNYLFIKKEIQSNINDILKSKLNINYFSTKKKNNKISTFKMVPHPFTNFTLNPNYLNKYGSEVHTIEGFRKTSYEKSILIKLKNSRINIVCIGGSSTQCSNMEKFEDTWPSLLETKFKNKVNVFNFGVGAWTTLHSYIRCLNWLDKIKPDIVLFYQAKNDLTPFKNGDVNEDIVLNDYQNVMSQFGESMSANIPNWYKLIPFYKLYFYFFVYRKRFGERGMLNIYKPELEKSMDGLKRFNTEALSALIYRYQSFFELLKQTNAKVIYIPEIVHGGEYEQILENLLFPEVKKLINYYDNFNWFDIKSAIPFNDENFVDKMHFTKKGNIIFSNLVFNYINSKIL